MYIRLQELREERGLSPKEAAKAAGVTEKTYRRYEEGIGRIRIPCVVNLQNSTNAASTTCLDARISGRSFLKQRAGRNVPSGSLFARSQTVHTLFKDSSFTLKIKKNNILTSK